MKYLIVFGIVFLLFVATFLLAQQRKKHDFLDIIWGGGFVVASFLSLLIGIPTIVGTLVTILVMIWGARLTIHLWLRNARSKEDYRYQAYRRAYEGKHFDLYFFFRMYVLQFVLNAVIVFPSVHINLQGMGSATWLTWVGLVIWLIGFFFESVGDWQLKCFISDPTNQNKIMTQGLWKYTRHPNYFGEVTQWWGIYLITISSGMYYWLIFSAVVITVLVRFVSGVPMLEKQFEGKAEWEEYKRKTPVFIPFFPKAKS